GALPLISILLLLFTANGIFEPLEVAFNRIWGISKNRSFIRNQLVSLLLIFACGGLALLSLVISGLSYQSSQNGAVAGWVYEVVFKMLALPLAVLSLFLVYRYLP